MMKITKLLSFLSVASLIVFSTVSCSNSGSDSNTSKTFPISDFSSLNIELVGEVIYEQSDSFYLSATGNSTLIEALQVSDNKGELSIELKNKRKYSGNKKKLSIRVGSPRLEALNFESIGNLYLNGYFQGNQLSITNKGVGQIVIEDCHVGTFNLTTKSVGTIEIKGTAKELFIQSEGVGNIDCSQFKVENTKVISKGAGNLNVYAEKSLDISLTGIGNVNYYGNPAEVKTDITGLGKASKSGS